MWFVYIGSLANIPEVYHTAEEAYARRDAVVKGDKDKGIVTNVWVFKEA